MTKVCRVCGLEKGEIKFPKQARHRHDKHPPRENTCYRCREKLVKKHNLKAYMATRLRIESRGGKRRRRKSYLKNKEKRLETGKIRRFKLKLKILTLYGGRCVNPNCGTTEIWILSIDHINNDGNVERRNKKSGQSIYRELRNKPKRHDLQILCHNCQVRKRLYGNDFSTWEAQKQFIGSPEPERK